MVKNFLPALLLALFFWVNVIFIVVYVSPSSVFAICYLLFAIFMALFLTLSLVLANSRRGFLLGVGVVVFLALRFFNIAHFLNLILLVGILISLEVYLRKR